MSKMRIEDRHECSTPGCHNPIALINYIKNDAGERTGLANYRKVCVKCHNTKTAAKHGLNSIIEVVAKKAGVTVNAYYRKCAEATAKSAGLTMAEYQRRSLEKTVARAGFKSITDYHNSIHEYRKYRGDKCENTDGRLGFVCTTNVVWSGMLDVDHIDGNPKHNKKANLQTLCKCCHAYKTSMAKDGTTPGRKTLKNMIAIID